MTQQLARSFAVAGHGRDGSEEAGDFGRRGNPVLPRATSPQISVVVRDAADVGAANLSWSERRVAASLVRWGRSVVSRSAATRVSSADGSPRISSEIASASFASALRGKAPAHLVTTVSKALRRAKHDFWRTASWGLVDSVPRLAAKPRAPLESPERAGTPKNRRSGWPGGDPGVKRLPLMKSRSRNRSKPLCRNPR